MNKLKEGFKKLMEKFKSFGKGVRIAIIIALVTFIIAIISMIFYSSANKYKVLFSNLDPNDAQVVTNKLKEKKVDMKIEGETIMVSKDKVDELRLELAPELSTGSKGYELMDSGGSFGMTDEEFKLKKLRMQQGELEKTIKSFPQVENVRVHITPSKDSVFVEDKTPGKAAVYIKLSAGNKLTLEQVRAIVALVSGSTENIPKENIEVVDDKMNLLSKDINNLENGVASAESVEKQYGLEKKYEENLQKSIVELLEPVVGKNKVKSTVNVDLDFDSKNKTETVINPNKVIISQETTKELNGNNNGATSNSPVDNNMGNTVNSGNGNTTSSKEQQKTNYESGKTETKTISAPGEVKRLTASVFIDGNLDTNLQKAVEQAVQTAIGFNGERGDQISVVGMTFDPATKENAQKEFDALNELMAKENRNKMITYISLGALALASLIIAILLFRKKKNKNQDEEENLLDVVIDDNISRVNTEKLPPIDFSSINPKAHIEEEIKKYATDKPDQVVDIIKSWLAEDER
ncbi:flagellar basal-body MS-ring/collar protein FliF [Clostridium carnis]